MKSTAEIIYEQSVRAIEQQVVELDELRGRSAIVLSAAGIASAFLGQAGLRDGTGPAAVIAILVFAVCALLCVAVLIPQWSAWTFAIGATSLMPHFLHEDVVQNPDALYVYLAEKIEGHYDRNFQRLKILYGLFWFACVALAVDVFVWLLELALD